mgnify:CR=1 FL=1
MSTPVHITLLGTLLALLFCSSMIALLWWMLHPPPQVSLSVAKAKIAISAIKKIIVPTTGTSYSERAVELACRLGLAQKAEIVVAYVIEVPFTLPLNAAMEKVEAIAKEALDRAVAIVEHRNLPVSPKIERARKVGEGIVRLATEENADLIVIGLHPIIGIPEKKMGRHSEAVLPQAPCASHVDR